MYRWYWRAVYNDGTGVSQLETNPATGREWSSESVDFAKLTALVLEPISPFQPRVIVQAGPGEIQRRLWRHYVTAIGGGAGQRATTWGLTIEDGKTKACLWLSKNNTAIFTFDFQYGSDYIIPKDTSNSVVLEAEKTGSMQAVACAGDGEAVRSCYAVAGTHGYPVLLFSEEQASAYHASTGRLLYPGLVLSKEDSMYYLFFRPHDRTIIFTTDTVSGPDFDVPGKVLNEL